MTPDSAYVAARRGLLDTLEVLSAHRGALVLVGAQAVYLHAPSDPTSVAYTTDADLAIDPDLLGTKPELAASLRHAGYSRRVDPGSWESPSLIRIDLMVPDAVASAPTRRNAPLEGHEDKTARRTRGIELALVDSQPRRVGALDPLDPREIELKVAGPAALVIAKAVKLQERIDANDRSRILAKDAGDLLRLLRSCDADAIGERLATLSKTSPYGDLINESLSWLGKEVSGPDSKVIALAVQAVQRREPERQVVSSVRFLVERLVAHG